MTNNRGGVTRLEETASTWTRAIVTGYDYVGRETSSSTALTDHTTISGTIGYDTTTGAVTSTTRGGVTEAFSYDTWGRTLTSTDGAGNTATTSYDTAGRTKTASDGKGSYTYSYDGTDTLGNIEHRGLATKIDLGYATGDTDAVAGAYDPAGGLVQQVLPGGYAQAWTRNLAGQATAMAYTQTVGGTTTPILGFTQTHDHLGRVVAATGPAGSRRYSYDDRARLSKVQDTGTEGCSTRVYGFTGDSNRTALATYAPDADGGCQTGTAAGTTSYSYDAADRITTTGYSYDRMGRTTTVPKAHTSNAADGLAGDLTVTYAANDMVASLQQTMASPDTGLAQARKQTFTLDGSDRVSTIKGYTDTVQLVETLNHYDSDTDSPAWTQTKTRPDTTTAWTTTWNRYIADLAGGLAIDIDNTGTAVLQLTNLHGDIVATTTLGQAGINTYTETNEYGQPKTGTTGGSRYGWLGTHQRDTSVLGGLTLMGARLYAPATGRFLSVDPIAGGNDNRYTYPADPINKRDLDGNAWDWAHILGVVSDIAVFIPGPVGIIASAVSGYASAYLYYRSMRYSQAKERCINTSIGLVLGGAGKLVARGIGRATVSAYARASQWGRTTAAARRAAKGSVSIRVKVRYARAYASTALMGGRRIAHGGRHAIAAGWVRHASYAVAFSAGKRYAHDRYWSKHR